MSEFSGPVHRPGEAGYDTERAGFNRAVEHHPELVVGATGPADMVGAVEFARADDLAVSVQATGHGISVPADGAVLINTARMTGVAIDPSTRSARIEAGARWEDVLPQAARHGLAPLNGSSPHVGAVGYTLGGGVGLLGRRYGYAADRVRRLDVVTADGRLRRVSADHDPDLFWALRGGKGNFGVVVSMEIELMPVSRLYGGGLYFSGELIGDVLHAWSEWARTAPEAMASSVLVIRYPPDPAVPEPLRDRFVTHLRVAWSGPPEQGERLVRPLRALGPLLMDTIDEMPYAEVGSIHHEPTDPVAAYDKSMLLRELDAAAVETIVSVAGPEADPPFILELRHHSGAYARQPAVANAVGGRDAAFTMFSASLIEPGGLEEIRRVHAALHERMRPWSTGGTLLNFTGIDDVDPASVRAAFAPRDYDRLRDLKAVYDPDNVFRINHNIPPVHA